MNNKWSNIVLAWISRALAAAFVVFTAWGWWDETQARQGANYSGAGAGDWLFEWAVLTHLLPLALILVAAILGWQRPIYGALGFVIYAILQAVSVGTEWLYMPIVVLPPVGIAVIFFVGWFMARRTARGD